MTGVVDGIRTPKPSTRHQGINLEEMFKSVDDLEANGMADSLGAEVPPF